VRGILLDTLFLLAIAYMRWIISYELPLYVGLARQIESYKLLELTLATLSWSSILLVTASVWDIFWWSRIALFVGRLNWNPRPRGVAGLPDGIHHVTKLVGVHVNNMNEVWEVLQTSSNARGVAATNANEHNSRSHWYVLVMELINGPLV
ncbi:hypothetical protein FRX31_003907, partial [Thalictrum thalictroides]